MRVPRSPQTLSSRITEDTPELVIAVLPDAQGQGIGTQLLTHLLASASQVHPVVMLTVRISNPARFLYERMGFERVATVRNRIGSESWLMLLRFQNQESDLRPQQTRRKGQEKGSVTGNTS